MRLGLLWRGADLLSFLGRLVLSLLHALAQAHAARLHTARTHKHDTSAPEHTRLRRAHHTHTRHVKSTQSLRGASTHEGQLATSGAHERVEQQLRTMT
eukprot:1436725-Rhodomonas_salina.3